jgi:transporter family-2 protein
MLLLLAFVAGATMAVQGSLNAALGKLIGLLEATFVVHLVGTAVLVLALFVFRLGQGDLGGMAKVPFYLYLGGLLSVVIIYAVLSSITGIGVATATTAIIAGQVGTALLIDHLGLFGLERHSFSWLKAAGMALLALGAKLMLMK